jgi:hypothetical protein
MPVQKERRAAPRKAAAPMPPKFDKPITRNMTPPAEQPAPEDVRRRIEMAAYFKAKARGFEPGYELEDWLQAEREVRQQQQR